jgi:tRNA pseudouridine55 synthase
MKPGWHGIIVIDKPAGLSSFGVVKAVRRLLKVKKIGHLGTLDPFATGVLPLCLNEATKLVPFLIEEPKTYRATLYLGVETDTQDLTGKVAAENPVMSRPEEIIRVMETFRGEQFQVPPLHSALRFRGQRLYHLARQGLTLEIAPRRISVHRLEIENIAIPTVTFTVTCSRGTYIRTLAADIGHRLGCGAHLKALRRLQVGPFFISRAVPLPSREDRQGPEELRSHLIALGQSLPHWRAITVGDREAQRLRHGQALTAWPGWREYQPVQPGERVRVLRDQELVAVAELAGTSVQPRLNPIRVFHSGQAA